MTGERRYQFRIVRLDGSCTGWTDYHAGSARQVATETAWQAHRGERLDVRVPATGEVFEDAPRTAP